MDSSHLPNVLLQDIDSEMADLNTCLVVKRLTQYTPRMLRDRDILDPIVKEADFSPTVVHRFLDSLCCLCNSQKGADGLVSLAVQCHSNGTTLWVATNKEDKTDQALELLREILKLLKEAIMTPAEEHDQLIDRICRHSAKMSYTKIENYRSLLKRQTNHIKEDSTTPFPHDESVTSALDDLYMNSRNPKKLSKAASAFQSTEAFRTLCEVSKEKGGIYSNARHMVGRLCSWHKAAQYLVKHTQECRGIIETADAKGIARPSVLNERPIIIASTVEKAMISMFGPRGSIVEQATSNLAYSQSCLNELLKTPQVPTVHAEVLVAQHFHSNNMRFYQDDRYIACSKPSCYACMLYLQNHPAGFAPRPCHGNAWIRWHLPNILSVTGAIDEAATIRLIRKIAAEARKDIEGGIIGGHYGRRRLNESTTGLSKSVTE